MRRFCSRFCSNVPLALCLAAALAAAGCVTPQDIEGLQSQLSEIQRQMLQAQRQAPSKQEIENLDASVGKQMDSLLKTEADMQVKLRDLSGQIDELQAKLEDHQTNRLAQLSQQIAATNQELKTFRIQQDSSRRMPPVPRPTAAPAALPRGHPRTAAAVPAPAAMAPTRRASTTGVQRLPQGQLRPVAARVPGIIWRTSPTPTCRTTPPTGSASPTTARSATGRRSSSSRRC